MRFSFAVRLVILLARLAKDTRYHSLSTFPVIRFATLYSIFEVECAHCEQFTPAREPYHAAEWIDQNGQWGYFYLCSDCALMSFQGVMHRYTLQQTLFESA